MKSLKKQTPKKNIIEIIICDSFSSYNESNFPENDNFFKIKYLNIKKNILSAKRDFGIANSSNNNIILFCAGSYGKIALKNFTKIGVKINFIIDNNLEYSEKKIDKTIIKNPSYLKKNLNQFSNHKILVCNKKTVEFNKIKLQLNKIGFEDKNLLHINI